MVTTERETPLTHQRPLYGEKLARLGVQILNRFDLELECKVCRASWSPRYDAEGKLPRGYWKCPNRCNW